MYNEPTTWTYVRRRLPWAVLLALALGWALWRFEQHVRADQHRQDMEMFEQWVRQHEAQVTDSAQWKL